MSENVSKLVPYVMPMSDMLSRIYPVGSIYMSVTSTSPADLFGGTWERIKDRFLLASGDTYSAGSTGGEAQHTLTVDEMPAHAHQWNGRDRTELSHTGTQIPIAGNDPLFNIQATGGSKPHNNMQPYLTVYIWKRVA